VLIQEELEEDHEAIFNSYLKPPGISDASFSYHNPSRFAYNTSRIHKERKTSMDFEALINV
jgi:hypothetical protein